MTSDWPPSEQAVIEQWTEQHYPDHMYCEEVPVRNVTEDPFDIEVDGSEVAAKKADLILLPSPSPQVREEIQEYVLNTGKGVEYDDDQNAVIPSDDAVLLEATLANWPDDSIPVQIFEAKQKLGYSALGQIIVYAQHFPKQYAGLGTDIEIVEAGLIYSTGDEMIERSAENLDLTTYQVSPPDTPQ